MKNLCLSSLFLLALAACNPSVTRCVLPDTPEKKEASAPAPSEKTETIVSSNASSAPEDLRSGNLQFGLDMFRNLLKGDVNQVFSPYSISSALAMTYRGAAGATEEAMRKTLYFGANNKNFHADFNQLNAELVAKARENKLVLNVANKLWGNLNYEFRDDFLDDVKTYYAGGFERIKMDGSGAAVKAINAWVEKQTQNKIKDLLKREHIDDFTRLVLVNAVYFLGSWATDFNKEATHNRPFHLASGSKVETKFMFMNVAYPMPEPHRYAKTDLGEWLELPYRGQAASMFVLLPKEGKSLKETLEHLDHKRFDAELASLTAPRVPLEIFLPKWKTTFDLSLNDLLKKMGMSEAFDEDKADFSLMFKPGQERLYIAHVLHKAFVEVSEQGTEAAAATAVIMATPTSSVVNRDPIVPIRFMADRPFLYFIRDRHTGTVLFAGSVVNPTIE